MLKTLLAFCLVSAACSAQQADAGYRLVMSYDRAGLDVPHWQIVLPPHGMAQYTGVPIKGTDPGVVQFRVSEAGRAHLGELFAHSKGLQPCETKAKGLANMGAKALEYTPPDGAATQRCTFNYTDNKPLNDAATFIQGLVVTLQTGFELDRLHRFDRLGLDPAMNRLVETVKDGRAVELTAIQPTLESLVTDTAVLDRVRMHAQQLLDMAKLQDRATP